MANLTTLKIFKNLGLVELARRIKRKFIYTEIAFMPCTPHLFIAVNKAFRHCIEQGISDGSEYLEFGIFRGFTLWFAQALADDLCVKDMRFLGFDSFFGLPPLNKIDTGDIFREGVYYCPRKDTEDFLVRHKTDLTRTHLVEGWFDKTLTGATAEKYNIRKCAICVIDCDLYESAKLALEFAGPLMCDKSVILFDDWGSFNNDPSRGEQKAFSEFLAKNPNIKSENFIEFGGHGKGFILRRK